MRSGVIYALLAFNFVTLSLIFFGQAYLQSFHHEGMQTNSKPALRTESEKTELIARMDEKIVPRLPEKIIFVGDVMLGRHVEYLMTKNGADYPFRNLGFLTEGDSYVVGNFEGTVPVVHQKTKNFGFAFSINKDYLKNLAQAGFTHFSLANNHALDFGESALKNSVLELTQNNLRPFGRPGTYASTSIEIIEVESGQVALIGFEIVSDYPTPAEIAEVLGEAKESSDWQVVYIHWGSEYQELPNSQQVALAKQLVAGGVDLIIGHHPHVVQSVELINNVPVFYSLGNFIFDQYFSQEVGQGLALAVDFSEKELAIKLLPVTSLHSQAQPSLMTGQTKELFLSELAKISAPSLDAGIKNGEAVLTFPLASSTEIAIMER